MQVREAFLQFQLVLPNFLKVTFVTVPLLYTLRSLMLKEVQRYDN